MTLKIEFLLLTVLATTLNELAAILGPLAVLVYYLSMLRKNVINKDFAGSWFKYFLSWFKK